MSLSYYQQRQEKNKNSLKNEIESLLGDMKMQNFDNHTEVLAQFNALRARIEEINNNFTKALSELKQLILDLTAQENEHYESTIQTLTHRIYRNDHHNLTFSFQFQSSFYLNILYQKSIYQLKYYLQNRLKYQIDLPTELNN